MREELTFESGGARCAAWLYRPGAADDGAVPCVVMAHGWSGVREQRLDAYAECFAASGMGVLVFDYRHFGSSEGEPRQLLDIRRQHEDWRAAVAYARGLDWVDSARLALWGSSFSGGHVVGVAADDAQVAAVVAQVPYADGLRNLPRLGIRHALRLTREGLRDQWGALRGRPPHMIPAVGPPGSLAVMTTPDAEPGFVGITPEGATWRNETAARICLRVSVYRPVKRAAQVRCPILFQVAEDDAITPPEFAEGAARNAPRGELLRYPGAGHFDVYTGALFDRVVADQLEFLTRHLGAAAPRAFEREPAVAARRPR